MTEQPAPDPIQVAIGTHVVVELETEAGEIERAEFDIVRPEAADYDAGFLGANTPLGKAILGKFPGRRVELAMGDLIGVRILSVTRAGSPARDDAAARRAAALDEARRKAERTSAEMFAASYGSKWGGYDMPDETAEESDA